MRIDALESSHPISIPVGHPDEISEIFDREPPKYDVWKTINLTTFSLKCVWYWTVMVARMFSGPVYLFNATQCFCSDVHIYANLCRISYAKGASIIRMMDHFLTTETFRKGLAKYLRAL